MKTLSEVLSEISSGGQGCSAHTQLIEERLFSLLFLRGGFLRVTRMILTAHMPEVKPSKDRLWTRNTRASRYGGELFSFKI